MRVPVPVTEIEFRFWEKVAYIGANENDCIAWRGAKNPSGHGRFHRDYLQRPFQVPAHVWAYERLVGPVPEGLHLDHLCGHPWCVNVDHLEPVSLWENLRRSPKSPGRINSEKTHCLRGHPLEEWNIYHYRGKRICKLCRGVIPFNGT